MTEKKPDVDIEEMEFTRIPSVAEVWRKVLGHGKRLLFPKGAQIYPQIAGSSALFFLDEGEVWMTRSSLDGREKIIWAMGPDSIFGETPFFDELPSRSIITAATKCTVYSFSRQYVFTEVLPCHPDLTLALFKSLALKVRVLSNQTVSLCLDGLPSRICKYLHLSQQELVYEEGPLVVYPSLNQQELANLLGVHRVTLNKALRELEKAGILGPYCRDEVYVLDLARFKELVYQNE